MRNGIGTISFSNYICFWTDKGTKPSTAKSVNCNLFTMLEHSVAGGKWVAVFFEHCKRRFCGHQKWFTFVLLSSFLNQISYIFFITTLENLFCCLFQLLSGQSQSIQSDVHKFDTPTIVKSSSTLHSTIACKLCLVDVQIDHVTRIQQCGCDFCSEVSIFFMTKQ